MQLGLRRAGHERVPARAVHRRERRTRDGCRPSSPGQDSSGRFGGHVAAADDATTGRSASTLPGEAAPRRRPRRPARRRASRARRGSGTPSSISSSVTRTRSRSRQSSSGSAPANGALRPSAIDVGSTGTRLRRPRSPRASARAALRLDGDRCARGRRSRGGDPGDQPAAADGDDHGVGVGRVLLDLEPDGARAGDHDRVVERVHERAARLVASGARGARRPRRGRSARGRPSAP